MAEKLKVYAIETNNGVFINRDPDNSRYGQSNFATNLFDGKQPQDTFQPNWSRIDNPPKRVSHIQDRPNINHRFELVDVSLASEKIPLVLSREQAGEFIGYEFNWKPEYVIYKSLYREVSDPQEPIEVDDEFEYIVLAVIDDIKEPKKISYPYDEKRLYSHPGTITNDKVHHSLIDQIVYPSILIHERPCKLTSKESYDIIREHIKLNIIPQVSRITSDYDFCFEVRKIIPLTKPYSYEYKHKPFGRGRTIMKTQYVKDREVKCFEMTSIQDAYKGYTPIAGFEGKNEDDLKEKVDAYLVDLMAMINEPLKECPNCNGMGVLIDGR